MADHDNSTMIELYAHSFSHESACKSSFKLHRATNIIRPLEINDFI